MQAHVLSAAACAVPVLSRVALQFLAFGVVVSLLATASAMKWTVTAQLICNTPTMILEVCCKAVPLCLQCPQTEPLATPVSALRYPGRPALPPIVKLQMCSCCMLNACARVCCRVRQACCSALRASSTKKLGP